MKTNRIFNIAIAVIALASIATVASAADYKIGVVNAVAVLEAAPQSDAARKKLEKEFSSKDKELVAKQKGLKSLEDRLKKDGTIMSDSERSRLERDILQKRRELKRDQDEFREDVNFRRNEEFGKIQKQIVEAIREVAANEKYDLVLGEGVIYASKAVDITESVIQKLKAGK